MLAGGSSKVPDEERERGTHLLQAMREGLHLIGREQRGGWVVLLVVALAASGMEIVGAALVYLLLALVADPGGEIDLPFVGDIRDAFGGVGESTLLLWLAAGMGVFFLLRAFAQVGEAYLQNHVGQNAGVRLSRRLVQGYLTMPYAFHLHRNSSELIRNTHTAVDEMVGFVFLPVIRITAEVVLITAMLALLVTIAPLPTGLAVLVIGSATVLLLQFIQPRLQQLGWTSHELNGETLRSLQQAYQGVRDVKILGREHAFAESYNAGRQELARIRVLYGTALSLPRTMIELALIGLILIIFAVAVATGDGAGNTLSVLGLFAYAGLRLQPSIQRVISSLNNLKFAEAPLETLYGDFQMLEEQAESAHDAEPIPFDRELAIDEVTLRYDGAEDLALRGIDLRITPGELIGICGPTGGGKTSLVDVMTGLLAPTSGRVTVDGLDLREHARGWQSCLGVVPQTVFLVDDTIRSNIALGLPNDRVDEDALREAVHLAQLDGFVAALPEGLDTMVGERGVRMSGGQRQRIAIARALYRRPSVLVFDEGTSALDNSTEAELMRDLEQLRGDHTILMIAHRLSTVRNCDRVVYVEDGRVAGLGSYEELAASNDGFRRMTTQQ